MKGNHRASPGECFGMLIVPMKYYREAKRILAQQRPSAARTA